MPIWLQAGLWGLLAGAALVLGAGIGYAVRVPQKVIAAIMAFGAGVLVSALTFELVEKANEIGGFAATAVGFGGGAIVYTLATLILNRCGARNRKRSNQGHESTHQPTESDKGGSGLAIALGALLDGVPEAIAIGLTLLDGSGVSIPAVAAIFLSNLPEGLSSASGMKHAGRSAGYIFGVWGAIALASGLAAIIGATLFGNFSRSVIAATTASAAGAILAMLASTMVPEAYEQAHESAGLFTVAGFLSAFALDQLA